MVGRGSRRTTGTLAARQIAQNVGAEYALPTAASSSACSRRRWRSRRQSAPVPSAAIVVSTGLAGVTERNRRQLPRHARRLATMLCGFGTNCAISQGKPTVERYDLLAARGARARALHLQVHASSQTRARVHAARRTGVHARRPARTTALIFLRRGGVKPSARRAAEDDAPAPEDERSRPSRLTAAGGNTASCAASPDARSSTSTSSSSPDSSRRSSCSPRSRPDAVRGDRAALERAKARLDRLDLYPQPGADRPRAHLRLAVVLPAAVVQPLRRLRRVEHDRAPRAGRRGRGRPRHARALPRLADAAQARLGCRSPIYAATRTTRTSSRPGARST